MSFVSLSNAKYWIPSRWNIKSLSPLPFTVLTNKSPDSWIWLDELNVISVVPPLCIFTLFAPTLLILFVSNPSPALKSLAKSFKCTASEALALAPVFGYYLLTMVIPLNTCLKQCTCMLSLIDLIEALQVVPLGLITPATLQTACHKFNSNCLEAGHKEHMGPTFHLGPPFPPAFGQALLLTQLFCAREKAQDD